MKKLIDLHHHVFPHGFKTHNWEIHEDQEEMERLGIDGVLLSCPLPAESENVRKINEFLAKGCSYDPKRYGMLASIPFDNVENALKEIEYALDVLKADGFAVPSNNHSVYLSDDRLDPVFEELNRRKATIFLHPSPRRAEGNTLKLAGSDDSAYEYVFDTTRSMMDFIYRGKMQKTPEIRWVIAHGGGTIPYLAYRLSHASEWRAAPLDRETVMSQIRSLYYDLALSADESIYEMIRKLAGAEHIVFGTDYPPSKEPFIARSIQKLNHSETFTADEKELVKHGNAEMLFARFQ